VRPRFRIRHYCAGDHVAIAQVFTRAVHELTCGEYDAEARAAWAPSVPDIERWRLRCELKRPFLAIDAVGTIAAFVELDADGHIDCTYVLPEFARQGAMTLLMEHVEAVARGFGLTRLYAEVSLTAQPFFLARGWIRLRDNAVSRGNVVLTNTSMEKLLGQ